MMLIATGGAGPRRARRLGQGGIFERTDAHAGSCAAPVVAGACAETVAGAGAAVGGEVG